MLVGLHFPSWQLWKNSGNILVLINIHFDLIHIDQKSKCRVIERSRKPYRVPQKSFQEPVLCHGNQAGRDSIMVGPVEKQKLEFGIVPEPMIPVEPRIKHFRPFKMNDD